MSNQAAGREGAETEYNFGNQAGTGPVSASYTSSGGYATAQNSANYGVLKLLVSRVSPVAPGVFGGPYAFTKGGSYWQDVVQIDSPGLTGQTGRVNVTFTIDGSTSASGGTGIDQVSYRFFYGNQNDVYDATRGELVLGLGILNNQRTHQIPFTFGTPFSMALTIEARVGSVLDVPGQAEVDASNTQTWGGYQSVTDNAGTPVSFTTSSSSGANYSLPILAIPEPRIAALVAASCLILSLRSRRRSVI